jgi:hypothetical protein
MVLFCGSSWAKIKVEKPHSAAVTKKAEISFFIKKVYVRKRSDNYWIKLNAQCG